MSKSIITCEIDLDRDGYQKGYLRLAHSIHRSAYGWIPIPIVSIKNGAGPVTLLLSGVHGDEYEGQVALTELAKIIQPEMVSGQIIILTMANYPAAKAGLRTSPIDEGNLNRSFPGVADGSPTEAIAYYIESELLKRADFLLDIHSGGSSLRYETTLLMAKHESPQKEARSMQLLQSLGFPKAVLFPEIPHGSYSSSAARRQNVLNLTAEVAGGGNVDTHALNLLRPGLLRYLAETGALLNEYAPQSAVSSARILRMESAECHVFAYESGLFESLVGIGEKVDRDQLIGVLHHPDAPWKATTEVRSNIQGEVICLRFPALTERGDCLFEIAVEDS